VVGQGLILGDLGYVECVLGNWHLRADFLELEKQAGKEE